MKNKKELLIKQILSTNAPEDFLVGCMGYDLNPILEMILKKMSYEDLLNLIDEYEDMNDLE